MPFETGILLLERPVLLIKFRHTFSKLGNLAKQLLDKTSKFLVGQIFRARK